MSTIARTLTAAALAAPLMLTATAPAYAAPTRTTPNSAGQQSPDPRIPVIIGRTLRQADQRVELDPAAVRAFSVTQIKAAGVDPATWVVAEVMNRRGDDIRISRYAGDGSRVTLARTNSFEVEVSDDGQTMVVLEELGEYGDRSRLRVISTIDGDAFLRRDFTRTDLLDIGDGFIVMSRRAPRRDKTITVKWNYGRDKVSFLSGRPGLLADISADRFVTERRSRRVPYAAATRRISQPRTILARTGRNYAVAWNRTGHRLLQGFTGAGEQQGLVRVTVRKDPRGTVVSRLDGRRTGTDFTDAAWESRRRWITVEYGEDSARLLRCDLRSRCSQAGDSFAVTTEMGYVTSPAVVLGS